MIQNLLTMKGERNTCLIFFYQIGMVQALNKCILLTKQTGKLNIRRTFDHIQNS